MFSGRYRARTTDPADLGLPVLAVHEALHDVLVGSREIGEHAALAQKAAERLRAHHEHQPGPSRTRSHALGSARACRRPAVGRRSAAPSRTASASRAAAAAPAPPDTPTHLRRAKQAAARYPPVSPTPSRATDRAAGFAGTVGPRSPSTLGEAPSARPPPAHPRIPSTTAPAAAPFLHRSSGACRHRDLVVTDVHQAFASARRRRAKRP